MKDLGKTKFCLGLQIEHFPNWVLLHQSTYIKKVLKHFYMDKTYSLSSPMVVGSLDVKMTHFVIVKKMKNYLVLKYYILALLVHLYILPIVHIQTLLFSVNLLARYSFTPTRRHWNGIKHILRYLCGITSMGLFYSRESKQQLLGYVDAKYL